MSEMEISKPSRHLFHILIQLTVSAACVYWHWHVPAPNKAVLWLAGVATLMALVEMRPMHKAVYFLLIIWLMFVENHALDKDRADFARDEAYRRQDENRQFGNIGDDIRRAIKDGVDHFDRTMRQFEIQNNNLAQLRQQGARLGQQLSDVPLSTMSPKELTEKARGSQANARLLPALLI